MYKYLTGLLVLVIGTYALILKDCKESVCEQTIVYSYFDDLPTSPVIKAFEFQHSTHRREAHGSDNWPVTWAADGHLYAIWGDGGGFGGTNERGRVSFGVARIEGGSVDYVGSNRHGGYNGEFPGQNIGYSWGLVSIDGIFYIWAGNSRSELFYSQDMGATWQSAGWQFGAHDDPFSISTFLNFGRDYDDSRDNYVYVYAPTAYSGWPAMTDGIDLARVPRERIKDREEYEFFAGILDSSPVWVRDINQRQPVFTAQRSIPWTINADYLPGLDRYLLSFTSGGFKEPSNLVILDAPTPWGPWTVAANTSALCRYGYTFAYHFPAKWLNDGGKAFTMIFSGAGESDSWNTIDGSVIMRKENSTK